MRFTKILALVLALMVLVSAFAACGGDVVETEAPANETEAPANETEAPNDCAHSRTREVPGSRVEPTCDTDGKYTVICRSCDATWDEILPAVHTYKTLNSTDGAYVKYTCEVCGYVYVADAEGAAVEDYSAIEFPFFYTSFDGLEDVRDIASMFEGVEYVSNWAAQVVELPTGEFDDNGEAIFEYYINIPTGNSSQNKNGELVLKDTENAFAAKKFTVSFAAKFDEFSAEKMAILTWTIGGQELALVSVDSLGYIYVIGNSKSVARFSDKGWDTVAVEVDPANGNVNFKFVSAIGEEVAATGKLGASVAGKTESLIKFMGQVSEYEAYLDEILFSVAK